MHGKGAMLMALATIATVASALTAPTITRAACPAAASTVTMQLEVCPPRLPTFGLTEREQIRLRHMVLSKEPLPHEIFGLQILIGAMGTQVAGLLGMIFGTCQIAPCISWLPGRVGDTVRATGWQTFAGVRSACILTSDGWRESGLQVSAVLDVPCRSPSHSPFSCSSVRRRLRIDL